MWEGQSRNMRRLMGKPWNRPATGVTASRSNHYSQTHIYPHYDLRNSFSLLVISKFYSATDMILSSDHSDPLTSHTPRLMLTSYQVLGSSVGYPTYKQAQEKTTLFSCQRYTRPQLAVKIEEHHSTKLPALVGNTNSFNLRNRMKQEASEKGQTTGWFC